MKPKDDAPSSSHDYWIHFTCGGIFGVGAGAWLGVEVLDTGWGITLSAVLVGICLGLACGRWGDEVWAQLSELLGAWWGGW